MTKDETKRFLAMVTELYPSFFADGVPEFAVKSWHKALNGHSLANAENALEMHYATTQKRSNPYPNDIASLLVGAEAEGNGCAYCRNNGHGDGYIKVIVPAGTKGKDGQVYPYGMEVYTDCPCQREARGDSAENIAHLKRNIKILALRGWLPYAYTNQELPEYEDLPY